MVLYLSPCILLFFQWTMCLFHSEDAAFRLAVFKVPIPVLQAAPPAADQCQLHPGEPLPIFCPRHVYLPRALQLGGNWVTKRSQTLCFCMPANKVSCISYIVEESFLPNTQCIRKKCLLRWRFICHMCNYYEYYVSASCTGSQLQIDANCRWWDGEKLCQVVLWKLLKSWRIEVSRCLISP